jgi:hypothetical protein
LVGDDGCVLGVSLALTAVALGGAVDGPAREVEHRLVVDGPAREVEHRLVVVEEDRDGQGGAAVGQIDPPGDLMAQIRDVGEEFEQFRLVVGDAS